MSGKKTDLQRRLELVEADHTPRTDDIGNDVDPQSFAVFAHGTVSFAAATI